MNVFILELKIYYGTYKFYGRSKFGQYDEVKNRAPFNHSFKAETNIRVSKSLAKRAKIRLFPEFLVIGYFDSLKS